MCLTNIFSWSINTGYGVRADTCCPSLRGNYMHRTHWEQAWLRGFLWSIKCKQKWFVIFFKHRKGLPSWPGPWNEEPQGADPKPAHHPLSRNKPCYCKPQFGCLTWVFMSYQTSWKIQTLIRKWGATMVKHKMCSWALGRVARGKKTDVRSFLCSEEAFGKTHLW